MQAVYDDTHTRLTCVKVSPSTGRFILTAGADAGVKALELQTLGNGYPRPIGSVSHTANSDRLAAAMTHDTGRTAASLSHDRYG